MKTSALITEVREKKLDAALSELYGKEALSSARERYLSALTSFCELYGDREDTRIFSVPGRSEISGNHTDHNNGRVLAASVNLDIIAVASPTEDGVIRLQSQGFEPDEVVIERREETKTLRYSSAALIAGVCDGFLRAGHPVGGFVAYTANDVFKGSGLSSSAAFEVMVGNILRTLYPSERRVGDLELAMIAQYAENEFFGKPCGLMDQTACAVGGLIAIDFCEPGRPDVEKLPFDLSAAGYALCIVNTGGNHADLNEDYASVPAEMKRVAAALGAPVLRKTTKEALLARLPALRKSCGDRAVLRALHYFNENARVERQAAALKAGELPAFLALVNESGSSSFRYLQNVYTTKNVEEQGVSLALFLAEDYLSHLKKPAACRVHGGGFAGTIQAFVPNEEAKGFRRAMDAAFGEGACHILKIRLKGAVVLV